MMQTHWPNGRYPTSTGFLLATTLGLLLTAACGGTTGGGSATNVESSGGAGTAGGSGPIGSTMSGADQTSMTGSTTTSGSEAGGAASATNSGGAMNLGGAMNDDPGNSGGAVSSGGVMSITEASLGGAMNIGGATNAGGAMNLGGAMNVGGAMNMGGTSSGGAATGIAGASMNAGGEGGTAATSGGQCEAIGWATRDGRTGGSVEVTGGGDAAPVVVTSFGELQMYARDAQARVIHIDGTLGSGWSGRTGDRLEVGSNKTIVGLRPGTELRAPIHVSGASNVIVRNLVIQGPGSNSDQAWDNLTVEGGGKNVWIDHCEFWDGQDGNADVVKGADNVTFTWNIFGYKTNGGHNLSNLVASSDNEPESVGKLNITFMFNWFTGAAQRQPRCRYGDIHVVNNLFTRDGHQSDYAISAGKDCRIITEANHFIDINTPIYTNHASGSAANDVRSNNIFENTSGNTNGYGTSFTPPYEYEDILVEASEVKTLVEQNVGATLANPSVCDW